MLVCLFVSVQKTQRKREKMSHSNRQSAPVLTEEANTLQEKLENTVTNVQEKKGE